MLSLHWQLKTKCLGCWAWSAAECDKPGTLFSVHMQVVFCGGKMFLFLSKKTFPSLLSQRWVLLAGGNSSVFIGSQRNGWQASGTLPHPGWNSHHAHSYDSALTAGSGGRSYCLAGTFPHSACEHIGTVQAGPAGWGSQGKYFLL